MLGRMLKKKKEKKLLAAPPVSGSMPLIYKERRDEKSTRIKTKIYKTI